MTIANELRAEVATALLVNRKGDPKELLNILKACDLEFRRLSSEEDRWLRKQPGDLMPTDSSQATLRARQTANSLRASEMQWVMVPKCKEISAVVT